jgi:outer membrane protein assembly factor BamA
MDIWFKDMPDHYWGVGYENGFSKPKSDSTTAYQRLWWQVNPIFLWQFRPHYFMGINVDYNYTFVSDPSAGVKEDPDYLNYGSSNFNAGLGINMRYDSRDIPVNAWKGTYLDLSATFYRTVLGGDNNYEAIQLDFRKYYPITSRIQGKTLVIQIKTRISMGNVPYTEMSKLGSPYDLRGYTWGQYRDRNMLFLITEYRHMFSKASGDPGRHGFVTWIGIGAVTDDITELNHWLPNIGLGYRFEIQPRMNLRIEFGFGKKSRGFYLNFNEAF